MNGNKCTFICVCLCQKTASITQTSLANQIKLESNCQRPNVSFSLYLRTSKWWTWLASKDSHWTNHISSSDLFYPVMILIVSKRHWIIHYSFKPVFTQLNPYLFSRSQILVRCLCPFSTNIFPTRMVN